MAFFFFITVPFSLILHSMDFGKYNTDVFNVKLDTCSDHKQDSNSVTQQFGDNVMAQD